MKFRTEIKMPGYPFQAGYKHPIFLMGSCFTQNIGSRLSENLFHIAMNPFGVTYNPESLLQNLRKLMYKEQYTAEDMEQYNDLFFSFDHYTKFSDHILDNALEKINNEFVSAKQMLAKADTLILSFGTAYLYRLKKNGMAVNNCHKLPAKNFERVLLPGNEIVESYTNLLKELKQFNPSLSTLFTVSPVRHLRDGFIDNQRSKSTLLLAVREIENAFPDTCGYFPSYEIVMDDLRDYRFYDSDLVHPNQQAIDYIWERFSESVLDQQSVSILREITPFLKACRHRPLHTGSSAYRIFLKDLEEKYRKLKIKFSFLNWPEFHSFST